MKTTVDLPDDLSLEVELRARQERRSPAEVLVDLARRALRLDAGLSAPDEQSFFGFEPLPHRGPAVSNHLIDRIRDELGE